MKVLVLGGTGFIGGSIVRSMLQDAMNHIVVFDRFPLPYEAPNLSMVTGDYSTATDFVELTKNIDVVIHAISTTSPRNFRGFYSEFEENVQPTIKLLDACAENGVKRFFFLSSGGTVYGENASGVPWKETDACNPVCAYGVHKLAVEKIMSVYSRNGLLKCISLRIANPYGPSQATNGVGVIATFARQMLSGNKIELIGDGKTRRDYIYIDDVVECVHRLMLYEGTEEVFNIGTGVGSSVLDIIRIISEHLNIEPTIAVRPETSNDVADNILDITRLRDETGFKPVWTVEKGIVETLSIMMRKKDVV